MRSGNGRGRRDFIKAGSSGLLSLALGNCARAQPIDAPSPRHRLEPVDASWGRVIRTTVGLRPHRPSGFIVRAERFDTKTLVHNYGHGGAGHSLGWGTGELAAELALTSESRRVAVIGCGTVGLTTARQLQRKGCSVTIYAKALPPNTTSNMAFAGFTPTSGLVDTGSRTASWDRQFERAAAISYRELQLMAGRDYGISWIPTYAFSNQPPRTQTSNSPFPLPPQTHSVTLQLGHHPFPSTYATQRPTIRIEPSIYLDAIVDDFLRFGGRLVIREFERARDLTTLFEPTIVNCTGLGSRTLFGDEELIPVKGQLTFLVPQPGVTYSTRGVVPGTGGRFYHMMPRADGIALGGTAELGVWDLEPNEDAINRIVRAHQQLFSQMTNSTVLAEASTGTEMHEIPSLESFYDLQS